MSDIGKWTYNESNKERWYAEETFGTREEAIIGGKSFFKDPSGYQEYYGENYTGDTFDIGSISEPNIYVNPGYVIDQMIEDVGEQCGDVVDGWLSHINNEEEELLGEMLTKVLKEWLRITGNKPHFYAIENIEKVWLEG